MRRGRSKTAEGQEGRFLPCDNFLYAFKGTLRAPHPNRQLALDQRRAKSRPLKRGAVPAWRGPRLTREDGHALGASCRS
jgi:hypothetical protein